LITKNNYENISVQEAVCSSVKTARDIKASIIICLTEAGSAARYLAKYRPQIPILALSMNAQVIRNMNLTRGLKGMKIATYVGTENLINDAIQHAVEKGFAKKGDNVICMVSENENEPDCANLMKITTI
jgi:pyruvate kinase